MKHDSIEINNIPWRVEFNWNTISSFLEENNLDLNAVDKLQLLKPSQITSLIHEGLKEGARIDGDEFPFSAKDIGAALSVKDVAELLVVFNRQVNVKNTGDTTKKKKLFSLKR